jgi:RNA polymerase sigma factor (sigma-70 family)
VLALRRGETKGARVDARDSEDGFSEAFDRYAPAILRYAQRRLDSREAAQQDVVSDTFTTAWRHWDRRPAPSVLLPWLYAIAGNSIRSQWRSAERRRRLIGRLSAHCLASHSVDPIEGVVLGGSISQALARLPAADQEVLRLVAWEGQADARMLGLALGLRPASARSRVLRARRRLRALLDETDAPAADPAAGVAATAPRQHARGA